MATTKRRVQVVRHWTRLTGRMLLVTARCGHQWSGEMSLVRYPDDGCQILERIVNHHEQQCELLIEERTVVASLGPGPALVFESIRP